MAHAPTCELTTSPQLILLADIRQPGQLASAAPTASKQAREWISRLKEVVAAKATLWAPLLAKGKLRPSLAQAICLNVKHENPARGSRAGNVRPNPAWSVVVKAFPAFPTLAWRFPAFPSGACSETA